MNRVRGWRRDRSPRSDAHVFSLHSQLPLVCPMLYLLHGADTFRSAARLRALRAQLDPNGFSSTVLDAQDASPDALRAACDALPFFGGGRCVEVRGLLTRWKEAKGKGAEREEEGAK